MSVIHRLCAAPFGLLLTLGILLAWSSTLAHEVDGKGPAHHSAVATAGNSPDEVRALIRAFRRTGDDRSLDAAWSRLQPLLRDGTRDASVLIDAATVAQSRHDFDAALELIDRALAIQPAFDQGWLLRASVQLVRGDAEQAEMACDRLRSAPMFVAVTCRARVGIARGDQANALRQLTAILAAADTASANPEVLAWTLSVAGDAAAAVDQEAAIDYYERSLAIVESTQVRAALVDVMLATDRTAAAGSVLESGHDALPLAVRRLIVAVRMGETDSIDGEIALMDHEFRHWIADGDWAHAREMARFYIDVLDRPALARRLAHINLGLQREPEDLVLARRAGECLSCAR